jgi:ATP-binding cassette subfamily B protein/subfamily B ATP-binding cassette protein MsbA
VSTRRSDAAIVARLLGYALRRWPGLLVVSATMAAGVLLDVVAPLPLKVLIDNVLGNTPLTGWLRTLAAHLPGGGSRQALLAWTVTATVLIFFVRWAASLADTYANIGFGQRLNYDLATTLFTHLQRLSLRYHARRGVGDLIRRVTGDTTCASVVVGSAVLPAVAGLITLAGMFAVMVSLDRELALLSLVVLPLMAWTVRRYAGPMADRGYAQYQAEGALYDTVEQTLKALPAVQAFGAEEALDTRFRRGTAAMLAAVVSSTTVQFKFKVLIGLATALGTALILFVGGRHVLDGTLTVGGVVVFLSYLSALYGPLEALLYSSSTVQEAVGAGRRVFEVLDSVPEVVDPPHGVALGRAHGAIRMEAVGFAYEPGRPALDGVSLEVHPGEVVAIVGPSGAGKTTLVGLVPRFADPSAGRILLDGVDLREITLRSLRAQVSLVLQDPFLFPASIADNIAYGAPHATAQQVKAAARAAGAHDFIAALSDGYGTVVGERGGTLSGGERQRISIARALLRDAPILVLDEPTAALDARTEADLLDALERLMAGRTTLVIAHRLSTVRRADRIVVLDHGRVVESGAHAELVAAGGLYARLHQLQTGGRDPAAADVAGGAR